MKNNKILIAETSQEFAGLLSSSLGEAYDIQVCHNGILVKESIRMECPDVLVIDLALSGIDGISLLRQIAEMQSRPRILVTTCFMSPYVESAIAELGVDMVVLKPCKVELLTERIQDLLEEEPQMLMHLRPYGSISGMLIELDIPSKRRGFCYLEKAIRLYMEQPTRPLTKSIYPEIGDEHSANSEAVERAIRQMIHESWERRDDRVWRRYFGPGRGGVVPRPTNAEFISRLAERYRQAREELQA